MQQVWNMQKKECLVSHRCLVCEKSSTARRHTVNKLCERSWVSPLPGPQEGNGQYRDPGLHHRKYMAIKKPKNFTFYVYLVMKNIPLSPTGLKVIKQKGLGPCSSIWCFLWHQQLQQRVQAETSTDSCCIAINTRTHIPTHSSWFHVNHATKLPKLAFRMPQEQIQLISQPEEF